MAAVTSAVVVAGASAYSAKKQSDAAKSAAKSQSKGVKAGQEIQREFTDKAITQLGTNYQSARDALLSGQEQFGRTFDEAGNILSQGYDRGRQDVTSGYKGAESVLSPIYQTGQKSADLQASLSGALGPEAQKQAYDQFISSPGQEWLQGRQEQAIVRNQAALGGGLGNQASVMQALQENAAGLAQQDFGNAYSRLSELTGRGDNAATNIANLRSQLGGILGSMSTSQAADQVGLLGQKASTQYGTQQGLADLFANEGTSKGNVYVGAGSEQTQLAQNLGTANAGGALYAAQNSPSWAQGLQAGLGAYNAAGGNTNFSSLFTKAPAGQNAGASKGGYTGSDFALWRAQQPQV
jgi:hypothetical protein